MSKKQITLLWSCQICLYIANIILTCIQGAMLIPCIIGWSISIMLAGLIIYLQFRLIDKQNTIDEINKEWLKSIKNWKQIIEKERQNQSLNEQNKQGR